jgi:hypothetical protein
MRIRERQNEPRPQSNGANDDSGTDSDATRGDAERLLAVADSAIERALSADSRAFLAANRQHGGQ